MKKTIGVYADTFNGKVGNSLAYMQYLSNFGYVQLINTTDNIEKIAETIDMLVIPGGADVNPMRYNAVPGVMDSRINIHYEYLDLTLIPMMINLGKPIVGICRGMQSLNVYFGGTLNQHIIGHHQGDNRTSTKQEIQFIDANIKPHFVNSMHHQSVDKLGNGIELVAYSQQYTGCYSRYNHIKPWYFTNSKNKKEKAEIYVIPEIIKHTDLPIIGFQYHPEEFNCEIANELIKSLLQ